MMGGMMGGMLVGSLLGISLILGFAYIVWVLANKEKGSIRTTGQVIAIIIAVLGLLLLLSGVFFGGRWGMMGPGMMR